MRRIEYFNQMRRSAEKAGRWVYRVINRDTNEAVYETSSADDHKYQQYARNYMIYRLERVFKSETANA